jgi:protein-disulfide isomerase
MSLRHANHATRKRAIRSTCLTLAAGYSLALAGCSDGPSKAAPQTAEATQAAAPVASSDVGVRYKIPVSNSQPTKGSADALVTIVAWLDLRSEAAAGTLASMNRIVRDSNGDVRLIHRNLAAANPDAVFANDFVRAIHETDKSKFWEAAEKVAALPKTEMMTQGAMEAVTSQVGLDWKTVSSNLQRRDFARNFGTDARFSTIFGATTSPTLFVNGVKLPQVTGAQLDAALDHYVAQERETARKLVSAGTAKDAVYDAVIADGLWAVGDDPAKRRAQTKAPSADGAPKAM